MFKDSFMNRFYIGFKKAKILKLLKLILCNKLYHKLSNLKYLNLCLTDQFNPVNESISYNI